MILRTYEETISTVPGIFVVVLTFYFQLHGRVNNSPSFSLLPSTQPTCDLLAAQCLKLLDSISLFALVARKLRTKSVATYGQSFISAESYFSIWIFLLSQFLQLVTSKSFLEYG